MDHEFDIDAFAFDADEGVGYRIIFETQKGPDLGEDERSDFHLTLRSAEGRVPERLRSQRSRTGLDEHWTAPQSGRYVLAVESAAGRIGTYRLEVLKSVIGEDDHGDDLGSATVVTAEEEVIGAMDHGADVDYFKVHVTQGYGYKVEVLNQTLESTCLWARRRGAGRRRWQGLGALRLGLAVEGADHRRQLHNCGESIWPDRVVQLEADGGRPGRRRSR